MTCDITWYGRCCFLVEIESHKVLFDPYDRFCHVEVGHIDAHVLLSSSTWHDHGHIGASPQAQIYTYPGTYEYAGMKITGIEAKENRGTPTVVFNLHYREFSITNFADLGTDTNEEFSSTLSADQKAILQSTSIAFLRANSENQNGLWYCSPSIIIPEHFFPSSFIRQQIPQDHQDAFLKQCDVADQMAHMLHLAEDICPSYTVRIPTNGLRTPTHIQRFMQIHPQVRYCG